MGVGDDDEGSKPPSSHTNDVHCKHTHLILVSNWRYPLKKGGISFFGFEMSSGPSGYTVSPLQVRECKPYICVCKHMH